jgi:hypothetical protein
MRTRISVEINVKESVSVFTRFCVRVASFDLIDAGGLESAKHTLAFVLSDPKRHVSDFRGKKGKQETKRETKIPL